MTGTTALPEEQETARRVLLLATRLKAFFDGKAPPPDWPPSVLAGPLLPLIQFALARMYEHEANGGRP